MFLYGPNVLNSPEICLVSSQNHNYQRYLLKLLSVNIFLEK